jgi:tetrapyrrole methylase family protein / MazG family protein
MIKIVGLGPGAKEAITLGTLDVLKSESKVFLRTNIHPNVEYLKELGVHFETYDEKYDTLNTFDDVYISIAEELMLQHNKFKDIVYAVPGHPLVAEKSVTNLIKLCEEAGVEYKIYPAVSFIDVIMERLLIDPVEGLKIIDAFDIRNQVLDKRIGTIITQVYNKFIASEVKLSLAEYYSDDTELYFIRAAGVKGLETIRKMPIYELDRQDDIDHLTSIYIPKAMDSTMDFNDLLSIMDTLRGQDGCPWDKEQTHESLKRYLVEECYEVLEAIDEKDEALLIEELGDVLFQIVFHAQLGKEEGYFNVGDVIKGVSKKMVDRHPHIFGNAKADTSQEVLLNWDAIKKEEKGFKTYTEELRHVPKNLPALMRAEKIQAKAKKVGFDWDKVEDALNKVSEELEEVKNVYKGENKAKILEEVGDLIFSSVNVSRFLDIDPENALNYTIEKFIARFQYIEDTAALSGKNITQMTLEEMDELWNDAKKSLSKKKEF